MPRTKRIPFILSCSALTGVSANQFATEKDREAAQEELQARECEGNCPCEACAEID